MGNSLRTDLSKGDFFASGDRFEEAQCSLSLTPTSFEGPQSLAMASAEDAAKKAEMNDQLKEYISQWREERTKEEAELKRLKDKQAARKDAGADAAEAEEEEYDEEEEEEEEE